MLRRCKHSHSFPRTAHKVPIQQCFTDSLRLQNGFKFHGFGYGARGVIPSLRFGFLKPFEKFDAGHHFDPLLLVNRQQRGVSEIPIQGTKHVDLTSMAVRSSTIQSSTFMQTEERRLSQIQQLRGFSMSCVAKELVVSRSKPVGHREVPEGSKVSKQDFDAIQLRRVSFHGEWNYTILPRS